MSYRGAHGGQAEVVIAGRARRRGWRKPLASRAQPLGRHWRHSVRARHGGARGTSRDRALRRVAAPPAWGTVSLRGAVIRGVLLLLLLLILFIVILAVILVVPVSLVTTRMPVPPAALSRLVGGTAAATSVKNQSTNRAVTEMLIRTSESVEHLHTSTAHGV